MLRQQYRSDNIGDLGKASASKPRVASAEVPMRSPEVTIGGRGSFGTALRLTVIPASCSRSSASLPVSSWWRRSTSNQVNVGTIGGDGNARIAHILVGQALC